MTTEIAKELKIIKDRMNEIERKLDSFFNMKHEENAANIDYIAMLEDVELPEYKEEVNI